MLVLQPTVDLFCHKPDIIQNMSEYVKNICIEVFNNESKSNADKKTAEREPA